MSSNAVNKDTGELITLSSGMRVWCGTKTAHDLAVQQGTIGNNILVCITDDAAGEEAWQYSTSETRTGKTWIDGKPIYRKSFWGNSHPSSNILGHISNLDRVIKEFGAIKNQNDGNWLPNNYAGSVNLLVLANGDVSLYGGNYTYQVYNAVIEYTKTTD